MKAILRETVYFSGAESLYKELDALDPDYRRAARIVEIESEWETSYSGEYVRYQYQMKLEAEIDASP